MRRGPEGAARRALEEEVMGKAESGLEGEKGNDEEAEDGMVDVDLPR